MGAIHIQNTHTMKLKVIKDESGCFSNRFSFIVSNAKWICEAKTSRSGSTRSRVVRSHLLNSLSSSQAWSAIRDLDEAVTLTDQGFAL